MGIDKKVKIYSLSDDLKILQEKLKQMESLKKRLKSLKLLTISKQLKRSYAAENLAKKYNSMQTLKRHISRMTNVIIVMKNLMKNSNLNIT